MKLLITGGCGFLGSNLAARAIENGDDLVIMDNLYREGSRSNLDWLYTLGRFRFQFADIRNENDITSLIKNFEPDAIFHLAGQVAMTTSIANPRMDFETNCLGTFHLLEAVRKYAPVATVVYSSTNKVYGNLEQYAYLETPKRYICTDQPNGFDESTPLGFQSPYGCSKGAADQYILDYARIFGLNTVVFRHSSMYGGRQFATSDQGWVGWFCQKAMDFKRGSLQEEITISGTGKQVRDVLHADDMVELYASAVRCIADVKGQTFNVGGGMKNSLSLIELFELLQELLDTDLNYVHLPARESDQRVFVAKIQKAETLLNWKPKISAQSGIERMLSWVSSLTKK
jgi:CDP-paratose 2-epimerase